MLKELIIGQVKGLIKKAIIRFSKELGMSEQVVGIMISAKNKEGDPKLHLYCNMNVVKEIYVNDLYSSFDIISYKTMGFDPDNGTNEWLSKFIRKASDDFGYDIMIPVYYLCIFNKELYAVMYVAGKQVRFSDERSDIPLEYILQTK